MDWTHGLRSWTISVLTVVVWDMLTHRKTFLHYNKSLTKFESIYVIVPWNYSHFDYFFIYTQKI